MRTWILYLAAMTAIHAEAAPVIATDLGAWKFSRVLPDTPESEFTQGAEATLTLGQSEENGPRVSVFLFSRTRPSGLILGSDIKVWHKFFFSNINVRKISVVSERVVLQHGHWRYFVEYLADDGAQTMVHCIAMAELVGEEIKLLSYQHENSVFLSNRKEVAQLFRNIGLRAEH